MKTTSSLLAMLFMAFNVAFSQTADEIIDNYIENIGGKDAWSKINSIKATGVAQQGGVDYPFTAINTKEGKALINIDLQGLVFTVEAFDGETKWAMNFQTQKAEAADSESSENYKNEATDKFPDPFMDYKNKGYSVALLGKEEMEGTECFKIKLTKKPLLVDGKEEENTEMYFFDTDNFVPIAMESTVKTGPAKGAKSQTMFSDYQEVDGVYMPYAITSKYNGQVVAEMTMKTVEFNADIDDSIFEMPEETTTEAEPKN